MGELEDLDEELEEGWSTGEDLEAVSFVCEDCDYRWEEPAAEDAAEGSMVCPMCGSVNVTQL
ncbi:MAG: hypothetical protein H7A21_05865 [Spirochaetales bacterium]|nr:hypothetical protein [Leptospiraceae bacterium]MCP5480936.1 hypothetical protein [Spirochaetales bacterium]MCP5485316.1 hypothetical protein [Spirochaetales bacterium]